MTCQAVKEASEPISPGSTRSSPEKRQAEILSTLAHEIKTPLTSIRAFIDLLINHEDEPVETRRRFLGIIREECERLNELVEDTLTFGGAQEKGVPSGMEAIDPAPIMSYAVSAVAGLAVEKGVRLRVALPSSLPRILGDRGKLVQVMENLLTNALKYSKAGGTVTVEAREEIPREAGPKAVRISVTDEGEGIGPAEFKLLFKRWSSVSKNPSQTDGNGLGLSISKEIVESHGGAIWVESAQGMGSTFAFRLPAYRCSSLFAGTLERLMKTARSRGEEKHRGAEERLPLRGSRSPWGEILGGQPLSSAHP